MNRNSSFFWGGSGASTSKCSDIFRGPAEASEPETVAIESLMAAVFPDQRGAGLDDAAPPDTTGVFLSIHSAGEYVLYPWEAIPDAAPNEAAIETLGRKFGFYNDYEICQDCLPVAAGTTVDEAYGEYGVAAYTFELGNSFFESCASFESTVLPDNLLALRFAAKAARRPYLEPAGPEIASLVGTRLPDGVTLQLDGIADDTRFESNGHGIEPTQTVQSIQYTVDLAPWEEGASPVAVAAGDGSFDEGAEEFSVAIDLAPLGAGEHLIYVTGTDSGGRRGVPTALLVEFLGAPIFADGFESGSPDQWSAQEGAAAVAEDG